MKFQLSWIGPRPEAESLSSWYTGEIPFYRYRHVVRPGISGWAQVNQGHVASVDEVHAKALELGGTDEGAPGVRGDEGPQAFYGAYFRDLDGNKLAAFCIGPAA